MERKVYPPGAGDVTLELGDEKLVLRATLNAGLTISRTAGGIRGAIDKVMQMDFDTIASVIRAGVGQKEAKKHDIEQLLEIVHILPLGPRIRLRIFDGDVVVGG